MEPKITMTVNYCKSECRSWFESEMLQDGSMKLIGMGSCIDYDKNGKVIGCRIESTGVSMIWTPPEKKTFVQRIFGF